MMATDQKDSFSVMSPKTQLTILNRACVYEAYHYTVGF